MIRRMIRMLGDIGAVLLLAVMEWCGDHWPYTAEEREQLARGRAS